MELDVSEQIEMIRQQMFVAAENLEFETAARLRDDLRRLQQGLPPNPDAPPSLSQPPARAQTGSPRRGGAVLRVGEVRRLDSCRPEVTISHGPGRNHTVIYIKHVYHGRYTSAQIVPETELRSSLRFIV